MYSIKATFLLTVKASISVLQYEGHCSVRPHGGMAARNRENRHTLMPLVLMLIVRPCTACAKVWSSKTRPSQIKKCLLLGGALICLEHRAATAGLSPAQRCLLLENSTSFIDMPFQKCSPPGTQQEVN